MPEGVELALDEDLVGVGAAGHLGGRVVEFEDAGGCCGPAWGWAKEMWLVGMA